jgi:glycosyltransferase involved in cell wall biosynthesis
MNKPLKILQVIHSTDCGGIETWLVNLLRYIDRHRYQMDFLVRTSEVGFYHEEITKLGSAIIPCLGHPNPWTFGRNFLRILKDHGPYHVVHCHAPFFSGFILRLAAKSGVKIRIAHSHSDDQSSATLHRRMFDFVMARWINQYATVGLAASAQAARYLFGSSWQSDPRWRTLYCGLDLSPFDDIEHSHQRIDFNIPNDSLVVGHVGRFYPPKNHLFFLKIAQELKARKSNVTFLLIGDGPLRSIIEDEAVKAGLGDQLILTGFRKDVNRLLPLIDVLLFPSLSEGLGLALIEAQACGIPCVFSNVVPLEADVISQLVHRVSLLDAPSHWADVVIKASSTKMDGFQALELIKDSPFNLQANIQYLTDIYDSHMLSS